MKIMALLVCTFLLITACTSPETPRVEVPGIATLSSQPPAPEATEPTAPEESKVTNPKSTAILLITLSEADNRLVGRPADGRSLVDLPGYQPIDFSHHYSHAFSPDGRRMALITWPSGTGNQGGVLHFIDLPTWTEHATDVTFSYFVNTAIFGVDGKKLYWCEPTRTDPAHGMPREFKLYRYDLESERQTEVLQLPTSFDPWEMHLLNGGSRLAIYGIPTTPDNLAEDAPHVLLVDLEAGSLAADVRLEGVKAGQFREETANVNEPSYQMYRPGLAWDLEHSLLYLVHGDSDRITVVDLAAGEVSLQADVRQTQSGLDRLLGWLTTTAQAKAEPETEKWAALDPNGEHLYVTGLRSEMEWKEESQAWVRRQVPLGVQVIATDNLSELQRSNLPVNKLALSPDGKWLLLTSGYDETGTDGQLERVAGGLYVVDAHSLKVTSHLLPESEVYLQGFSPDGRFGYVSTATSEWLGDHWGNWKIKLYLLELEPGKLTADRELPGYFLEVNSLSPGWAGEEIP